MQIRRTAALALGAVAAGALLAAPAFAQMKMSRGATPAGQSASRAGDIWTGGGILFAPRYLNNPGDFELGGGLTYLAGATPSTVAPPIGLVAGIDYKITDALELAALVGPVTLIGLRGPLMQNEFGAAGWAVLYRADLHAVGVASGSDLVTPPLEGRAPLPFPRGAAVAQGAEIRMDILQSLGPVTLFGVPTVAAMSNGFKIRGGVGLDFDFGRGAVGVNWVPTYNLTPPATVPKETMNNFPNQFGAGGRFLFTDNFYLVGNFVHVPYDDYFNSLQNVLLGVGYRFGETGGGPGGMRLSK